MAKKKNKNNNNNGSNNDDDHNTNNNGGGGGGGGGEGNDGGGKKENAILTVVLRVDLHCEGCAGKVVKAIRSFDGVESVRIGDIQLNKLTVVGKLDPVKLRDKVAEKTKRKVELVSPAAPKKEKNNENEHPNNSGAGAEPKKQSQNQKQNQNQQKDEKSAANKKDEKKPKELPLTTAVFKVQWHCRGCIEKIHRIVSRTKGYVEMSIDKEKDLVSVKGAMDMKALADTLKEKLKRPVEIVPAKKEAGGGDKGNNGNNNNADGGEKKEKTSGSGGNGGNGGNGSGGKKGKGGGNSGGAVDLDGDDGYKAEGYRMEYGGQAEYPNPQYAYGPGYMVNYVHAPQLFSDENPHACVIM